MLNNTKNPFLQGLAAKIKNWDLYPHQVPAIQHKIVSILKAFIRPSHFIILDNPDDLLEIGSIMLLEQLISFEASQNGRTFFISSNQCTHWEKIISKILCRSKRAQFVLLTRPKNSPSLEKSTGLSLIA